MPIPDYLPKLERTSAKLRAFTLLQQWIKNGTLAPGEKISDTELAKALGLSRTPVREALQMLEMQGFIEMKPGSVTRVTLVEKEDIFKIYPPLAALDAIAAETAAEKIDSGTIKVLRDLNQQFATALMEQEIDKAMELDERFHQTILGIAANPFLTSFITTLQMHVSRFKYVFLQQLEVSYRRSVEEHEAILDALESQNSEKAGRMIYQNWMRPMTEIVKQLAKDNQEESLKSDMLLEK